MSDFPKTRLTEFYVEQSVYDPNFGYGTVLHISIQHENAIMVEFPEVGGVEYNLEGRLPTSALPTLVSAESMPMRVFNDLTAAAEFVRRRLEPVSRPDNEYEEHF